MFPIKSNEIVLNWDLFENLFACFFYIIHKEFFVKIRFIFFKMKKV